MQQVFGIVVSVMQDTSASEVPPNTAATRIQRDESLRLQSKVLPLTVSVVILLFSLLAPTTIPRFRRVAVAHVPCKLGSICTPEQKRPLLDDGSQSRAIWDLPRYYMRTRFERGLDMAKPGASVTYLSEDPVVVYFDGVLEEEEIDAMIDAATPRLERSHVVSPDGSLEDDSSRTSSTAWLPINEDPRFPDIVDKCARLIGFTRLQSEEISVNKYERPPGATVAQQFLAHHDFFADDASLRHHAFDNCQRAATILIYLSDPIRGGETLFLRDGQAGAYDPNNPSHVRVTPKRGRVLAWFNCHPNTEKPDFSALHAGMPTEEGVKLTASLFIRNCTSSTPVSQT